ncbi:hypothetical protein [Methylobacterium nodulans]|uniref:Uncharacterized protein n=1 Tax=Methylobacterium nodulans (strain LMG 21967 / CNCM I-2342 / ORS 2060) TaxID=460265 RepID=B8IN97_METNO|nr:hypothetical protein [Methylobacterium nodulans]ACL62213.1 hypothetical protein Mnod_7476 [Methylobacterium nodulans ORS 2060]
MAQARTPRSLEASTSCPVEDIVAAYLTMTAGDPALALRCAVTDALADLLEAERRTRERSRLIAKGRLGRRLDHA